jgi:hypothetical protein
MAIVPLPVTAGVAVVVPCTTEAPTATEPALSVEEMGRFGAGAAADVRAAVAATTAVEAAGIAMGEERTTVTATAVLAAG